MWLLLAFLVLLGTARADPLVLVRLEAPSRVSSGQPFNVTVSCASEEGKPALEGANVTICLADGRPVANATVGQAVPITLTGAQAVRLIVRVGTHYGVSGPIQVQEGSLPEVGTVSIDPVPTQWVSTPFQVTVTVLDKAGLPISGADVSVRMDPRRADESVLLFSDTTVLSGATGWRKDVRAVTDSGGRATLWIRLYNSIRPFDAQLVPVVLAPGPPATGEPSNVFKVLYH